MTGGVLGGSPATDGAERLGAAGLARAGAIVRVREDPDLGIEIGVILAAGGLPRDVASGRRC